MLKGTTEWHAVHLKCAATSSASSPKFRHSKRESWTHLRVALPHFLETTTLRSVSVGFKLLCVWFLENVQIHSSLDSHFPRRTGKSLYLWSYKNVQNLPPSVIFRIKWSIFDQQFFVIIIGGVVFWFTWWVSPHWMLSQILRIRNPREGKAVLVLNSHSGARVAAPFSFRVHGQFDLDSHLRSLWLFLEVIFYIPIFSHWG